MLTLYTKLSTGKGSLYRLSLDSRLERRCLLRWRGLRAGRRVRECRRAVLTISIWQTIEPGVR